MAIFLKTHSNQYCVLFMAPNKSKLPISGCFAVLSLPLPYVYEICRFQHGACAFAEPQLYTATTMKSVSATFRDAVDLGAWQRNGGDTEAPLREQQAAAALSMAEESILSGNVNTWELKRRYEEGTDWVVHRAGAKFAKEELLEAPRNAVEDEELKEEERKERSETRSARKARNMRNFKANPSRIDIDGDDNCVGDNDDDVVPVIQPPAAVVQLEQALQHQSSQLRSMGRILRDCSSPAGCHERLTLGKAVTQIY